MGIDADPRAEPKLDCKEDELLKFSGEELNTLQGVFSCGEIWHWRCFCGFSRIFEGFSRCSEGFPSLYKAFRRVFHAGEACRPLIGPRFG